MRVERQQKGKHGATCSTNSWNYSSLLLIPKLPSVSLTTSTITISDG